MSAAHYAKIWDDYWSDTTDELGQVFWDSRPEVGALDDLHRFGAHLDPGLPLVDVGCGHGTQARALAERFARVVGVDVSEAGLAIARAGEPRPGLEFARLDLLDAAAPTALHARLGDANVYVRAVLHQLDQAARVAAAAGLAGLLGARGRALVVELSPAAEAYFEYLFAEFAGPPPGLRRVLRHGIQPAALQRGDLTRLFALAGLAPIAQGKGAIHTTLTLPGGQVALVPTDIFVFGRASEG